MLFSKRSMSSTTYPSDLADAEWRHLEPLLPAPKATGRRRQWPLRLILNGIFYLVRSYLVRSYLVRSGCAWRMLPKESPPWPTVYDYYRRWRQDGTWERIHAQVRQQVRRAMGRQVTPSGAVLESQSIKTTEKRGLLASTLASTLSASMASRRSRDASVICWWIHRDWCSKSRPQALISLNAMELANCWSL
jgi:transposase